jgi:Family of unknown function (DUF6058)
VTGRLPDSAERDIAYVKESFRPMDESSRSLVERGILPEATYVLPDGTAMVPDDHAQLLHEADGDPGAVAHNFRARFMFAGGHPDELDGEYQAWLSGDYGACLYATTPEAIVAKSALISAIEALLAGPAPRRRWWCGALRGAVDALDSLERQFTEHDRQRFGAPTSRDRLITATRELFPEIWSRQAASRPDGNATRVPSPWSREPTSTLPAAERP